MSEDIDEDTDIYREAPSLNGLQSAQIHSVDIGLGEEVLTGHRGESKQLLVARRRSGLDNAVHEDASALEFAKRKEDFQAGRTKKLTLPSGVILVSDKDGDKVNFPRMASSVRIHYDVYRLKADGTPESDPFDSSRAGHTVDFQIGVGFSVPGAEEAIFIMSRGQRCRVRVPPHMAYRDEGFPTIIPKNSPLLYDIQLISFE